MVNKDLDFVKPYQPFDYSVPLYVARVFSHRLRLFRGNNI